MSLFDDIPPNACPAYLNIRSADNAHTEEARLHCEDLWQDFKQIADPHFLTEFPLQFHQRWFEMYLTVTFLRIGFDVECPKPGPDILLHVDGRKIWIEAVCASGGDPESPDAVPELEHNLSVARRRPTDEMVLRIANSIQEKQKKFLNWRSKGLISSDEKTVIAVNIHGIPWAWVDIDDLMRRTLYGLGDEFLTINKETMDVVDRGYQRTPEVLKKGSGSSVSVQPFVDGSLPHISAVLGSWEDVCNRSAQPGDGFILYPNISAETGWISNALKIGEEWVSSASENGEKQLSKFKHKLIDMPPQLG